MKSPIRHVGLGAAWAALLAAAMSASAQSYSVSWFTFDGGGGPSSSGTFSLNGTAGQPEAGAPSSGGQFTLHGGFWPGVMEDGAGPAPHLSIRLGAPVAGTNTVILTWPNPSTGYVLQQTANMSAPGGGWREVTQIPVVNGSNKEVTLPATGWFCMFRLRQP